jgi:hypothetical protein
LSFGQNYGPSEMAIKEMDGFFTLTLSQVQQKKEKKLSQNQ